MDVKLWHPEKQEVPRLSKLSGKIIEQSETQFPKLPSSNCFTDSGISILVMPVPWKQYFPILFMEFGIFICSSLVQFAYLSLVDYQCYTL